MKKLSFKPHTISKRLITSVLSDRSQDIIKRRYGLGDKPDPMTLEAIGQIYDITRERVRQIENQSLKSMRESDVYDELKDKVLELEELVHELGTVIAEDDLLNTLGRDTREKNHFTFLLTVGHPFGYEKADDHFTHRWHADEDVAGDVETALKSLYQNLSDEELLDEAHILDAFLKEVSHLSHRYRDEEILKRWLGLSKKIGSNELGHWGPSDSPKVSPRGIRDYAYLVILEHGSPLHFREVAQQIKEMFGKTAHTATVHNELIKDDRFVLVGRGLYALSEWGYMEGVVRDVIKAVLKEHGPMTRDEVIDKVLKERYVKPNTVLVNLQDVDMFKQLDDGRYTVA